jgi:hypothetical protein
MAYAFTFKLISDGIAYRFTFNTPNTNVYQLFFFGFNLLEVVRYTVRYAEFTDKEREAIVYKLLISDEITNEYLKKAKKLADAYTEVTTNDLSLISSLTVPVDTLAKILVESLGAIDNNNKSRITKYVEGLFVTSNIKRLWKNVQSITSGGSRTASLSIEYDGYNDEVHKQPNAKYTEMVKFIGSYDGFFVEPITEREILYRSYSQVERVNQREIGYTEEQKHLLVSSDVNVKRHKLVDTSNATGLNKPLTQKSTDKSMIKRIGKFARRVATAVIGLTRHNLAAVDADIKREADFEKERIATPVVETTVERPRIVTPVVETSKESPRIITPLVEVLEYFRPMVELVNNDITRSGSEQMETDNKRDTSIRSQRPGVSGLLAEVFSDLHKKQIQTGGLIIDKNPSEKELSKNDKIEIGSKLQNRTGADTLRIEAQSDFLKNGANAPVLDIMSNYIKGGAMPPIVEGESRTPNGTELNGVGIDSVGQEHTESAKELGRSKGRDVEPIVNVDRDKEKFVDALVTTAKQSHKGATPRIDTSKLRYRQLRMGRRWRFKTGSAYDKIWLNPRKGELTEEYDIRVKLLDEFRRAVPSIVHRIYVPIVPVGKEDKPKPTLVSIWVQPVDDIYRGDSIDLIVMGTYSDGTISEVTDGCTFNVISTNTFNLEDNTVKGVAVGSGSIGVMYGDFTTVVTVNVLMPPQPPKVKAYEIRYSQSSVYTGDVLYVSLIQVWDDDTEVDVSSDTTFFTTGDFATCNGNMITANTTGMEKVSATYDGGTIEKYLWIYQLIAVSYTVNYTDFPRRNAKRFITDTREYQVMATFNSGFTKDISDTVHFTSIPLIAQSVGTNKLKFKQVGTGTVRFEYGTPENRQSKTETVTVVPTVAPFKLNNLWAWGYSQYEPLLDSQIVYIEDVLDEEPITAHFVIDGVDNSVVPTYLATGYSGRTSYMEQPWNYPVGEPSRDYEYTFYISYIDIKVWAKDDDGNVIRYFVQPPNI